MNVKIKRVNPDAKRPFKKYMDDFCYDVYATSEEEIAPNVWKYGIGWAFEPIIPVALAYNSISIDLRPRSSVWETGMVLSNCIGTIDSTFRGEASAVFYHVFPNMPRYKVGDRIGQIKIGMAEPMTFVEVEDLGETERGSNGYGSTGGFAGKEGEEEKTDLAVKENDKKLRYRDLIRLFEPYKDEVVSMQVCLGEVYFYPLNDGNKEIAAITADKEEPNEAHLMDD